MGVPTPSGSPDAPVPVPPPEIASTSPAARAPRTPFAGRASNLLLILGMAAVGVALFVFVPSQTVLPLRLAAGALTVLTGAGMLLASFALDRRRPWAPAAAAAILWIVLVVGIGRTLGAFASGSVWVPLDAMAAAWALSAAGRPSPLAAGRSAAAWALIAMVVVARLGEPFLGLAFTPGVTPLAVGPAALGLTVEADCDTGATMMPDVIHVTGRWSWLRADLFPAGTDAVGFGITQAPGASGDATMTMTHVLPAADDYLSLGGQGAASGALGRQLEGSSMGATWVVSVEDGGLRDGTVSMDLVPVAANPLQRAGDGYLVVHLVYAHLDRWTRAVEVGCRW